MSVSHVFSGKCDSTYDTGKWLFTGVSEHVDSEVIGTEECLAADFTFKRTNIDMNSKMANFYILNKYSVPNTSRLLHYTGVNALK